MTRAGIDVLAGALVLALYLGASLWHLDTVPPVYEDEPWQASTGWKLATDGVLGSDVFAGLHRMDEHYYGYMPLHAVALAAAFRVAGVGLVQARLVSVAMGFLTLLLAAWLAGRLADRTTAVVALLAMVGLSVTGITAYQPTGIPMLDTARIARYDMVVPVFGLAALHAFLGAARRRRTILYVLAGLLTGLAALSHVYGAFWLVAFVLLLGWERAGWRALGALLAGFALPWLLYAGYVVQDLEAWRGQTAGYAPRFNLLDWQFYRDNLRAEPRRYFPGIWTGGWRAMLRPGLWMAVAALIGVMPWLLRRAVGGDRGARALAVPLVLFPALFALVIRIKLTSYLVLVVPVAAVAVAWGLTAAWRRADGRNSKWGRTALAAAAAIALVDGGARVARLAELSRTTTPASALQAKLHAPIPPGSRVLGLHAYWFGFEDTDYRSWVVPWLQAFPEYGEARPLESALDGVAPGFVILDPRMRAAFADFPERGGRVHAWLRDRGFEVVATIDDPTYGRFEVFGTRDGR